MERKQLLLVDDDPGAVHALAGMLRSLGELRFATNGADALRLARQARPDLMLLDLQMPAMSGPEVCRALRRDRYLADLPVVIVTADPAAAAEAQALGLGVVDFLHKPLVAEQVLARVSAVLRRLPAPAGPAQAPGPARAHPPVYPALAPAALPPRQPTILIVDDDAAAVHGLRIALAPTGARVHVAVTASDAQQLAHWVRPDLVLLELHLPDVHGLAWLAALQQDPLLAEAAVMVVTRLTDVHTEAQALSLGAVDFVPKPYSPAVLQARVRNALRGLRRHPAQASHPSAHPIPQPDHGGHEVAP